MGFSESENQLNHHYTRLKALLEEQGGFPQLFIHKLIGRNTPTFDAGLAELEQWGAQRLRRLSERLSGAASEGDSEASAHRAVTYQFAAQSSDEIIELYKKTKEIQDLKIVL